ncbi:MAG TPA: hypothetical protein VK869_07285 [Rubrobacteraceae bacterium]|nr:hypothetical protein [Rubrobacteraceae bacterium]
MNGQPKRPGSVLLPITLGGSEGVPWRIDEMEVVRPPVSRSRTGPLFD